MADVGASTTGRVSRREKLYHEGHEALLTWGAFQRAVSDGSPGDAAADPIFRDVMSGYRESTALRYVYDEDYALLVDRLLGRILNPHEVTIVTLGYVIVAPSGRAAKALEKKHPRDGARWTPDEYRMRLDESVARVDMALQIAIEQAQGRRA